jgi:GNAT superfamily N-acetyltransferase
MSIRLGEAESRRSGDALEGALGLRPGFLERARPELSVDERDIREGKIWIAERAGRTVGFCLLDLASRPPELAALFVEPDQIGQGVGTALLRHALARARDTGVSPPS